MKTNSWQDALIHAVTDPEELLHLLELDPEWLPGAKQAAALFPLKITRSFIARMEKGNPFDPLLRQVLPLGIELAEHPDFQNDPLEEARFNPLPGLLHKYHGRVLLTPIGTCGINCRYCFRRAFPYQKNNPGSAGLVKIIDYIRNDPTISEVILSGGDPLVASDAVLQHLIQSIESIPHVTRLRIHSRIPIVLPERMTSEFVALLKATHLKIVLIVHANHPQEINHDVKLALQPLRDIGVTLLNQSVLLKGINDDADTLIRLSHQLFAAGILPYNLYLLDKVQGAAHFDLSLEAATALHHKVASQLSGYLVPKLVREQPGAPAKQVIATGELYTD